MQGADDGDPDWWVITRGGECGFVISVVMVCVPVRVMP
jgi:hypothetical protein